MPAASPARQCRILVKFQFQRVLFKWKGLASKRSTCKEHVVLPPLQSNRRMLKLSLFLHFGFVLLFIVSIGIVWKDLSGFSVYNKQGWDKKKNRRSLNPRLVGGYVKACMTSRWTRKKKNLHVWMCVAYVAPMCHSWKKKKWLPHIFFLLVRSCQRCSWPVLVCHIKFWHHTVYQ